MVENGYRHLSEHPSSVPGSGIVLSNQERRNILLGGAKQVGPAIFFSLLVILVSFLPVFLLEARKAACFVPSPGQKLSPSPSLSILAITLVPV